MTRPLSIELEALQEKIQSQFRGLNPNEPGQWPLLPKALAWLAAGLLALFLVWFLIVSDALAGLEESRAKEQALKLEYQNKLSQAINLDELRKQKVQVQEFVHQLERQLPGKAEMDALLSDINQAGLGRGLQFELFRPGQEVMRDFFAELPISIRVTGRYHDMGAFAADVANLSRIVTLHNLTISNASNVSGAAAQMPAGVLAMEATARTYRYLDPTEVEQNRKAKTGKDGKPAGGNTP